MAHKQIITGFLPEELEEKVVQLNLPVYRARQILDWIYKKCVFCFDNMQNLSPDSKKSLSAVLQPISLKYQKKFVSPSDKTTKYIFSANEGGFLEAVFIPVKNRSTVCVSTQLGCSFNCIFCASGKGNFQRNLSADEIVSQLLWIKKDNLAKPITNIVIMGMGEPLANYENTLKAVRIFNHPGTLKLGARKITISTCGLPKQILRLAREKLQVELSISLHAASCDLRTRLMPVNKIHPITELVKTAKEYSRITGRIITFEYILIKDVNDHGHDAEKLADLLSGFKCKVNLITFNPIAGLGFEQSTIHRLEVFESVLKRKKVNYTVRRSRGCDIKGACGQLRAEFADIKG